VNGNKTLNQDALVSQRIRMPVLGLWLLLLLFSLPVRALIAQSPPPPQAAELRVTAFGARPDGCDGELTPALDVRKQIIRGTLQWNTDIMVAPRPNDYRPVVLVAIEDAWEAKIDALDAHVSQVHEWLPWVNGRLLELLKDSAAHKKWLSESRSGRNIPAVRAALEKRYGAAQAQRVRHAEFFELCERGQRPNLEEL
jgi:hypothetical protein